MTYVTLQHTSINSGTAVTVLCNQVSVVLKKNMAVNPNANIGTLVGAQTLSVENPKYSLIGVHFSLSDTSVSSGTLTYPQALTLLKQNNVPGSEVVMNVFYGTPGASYLLPNYGMTLTGIKGVVTDVTYPIDATNSKGGYVPIGTIMFTETP